MNPFVQSKDFTDINSESVGQMELEWLPLPCRILLYERSAAENVMPAWLLTCT